MKIRLTLIDHTNVAQLQPLLQQPQLLQAAGMDYQPALGLWGFKMMIQHERIYSIQVNQRVVGLILLSHLYDQSNQIIPQIGEVGYCVLPVFQNQGIATQAIHQLLNLSVVQYQMPTLIAEVAVTNHASQRVLVHNHFARAGTQHSVEQWRYQFKEENKSCHLY